LIELEENQMKKGRREVLGDGGFVREEGKVVVH